MADDAGSWQQQVLARGWGYAILTPNSIQADSGAGLTRGIIGLCNKGQPRKLDDWGALRAWAWGASRALDYFETDKAVDAKQVGIEGLSRYGKAAIVTMAYDARFAIGFVGSSGAGGAKLHRRNFGEQVENVAARGEYHWMAGNFLKYAGPLTPKDLPVDAHELIALCAPRPVFISVRVAQVEGRLGGCQGHVPGRGRGGAGVQVAGQEGPGHQQVPAAGDGADRRRHRLPPACRRTHDRPELADVPEVRRPLPQRTAWGACSRGRRWKVVGSHPPLAPFFHTLSIFLQGPRRRCRRCRPRRPAWRRGRRPRRRPRPPASRGPHAAGPTAAPRAARCHRCLPTPVSCRRAQTPRR